MENGDFKIDIQSSEFEPALDVKIDVKLEREIKTENINDKLEHDSARSIGSAISGNTESDNNYYDLNLVDYKPTISDLTFIKEEVDQTELIIKDELDTSDEFLMESESMSTEDNENVSGGASRLAGNTEAAGSEEENVTQPFVSRHSRARGTNCCYFCKKMVLNFARHIMRHHLSEYEVQEIFSFPAYSNERKQLLSALRKKSNYANNSVKCVRPVRKGRNGKQIEYLPCPNCLGFYSREQIYRHRKACDETITSAYRSQVECQNFLVRNLNVDKQVQEEIFPKMRPDKVSLVVKMDSLICAFGAQYIKSHREKKFLHVASRKMRELAKVLMEMQRLRPSIKDLRDALKPQNYNLLVAATKHVAGYDKTSESFASPTFAMNISASYKQCCRIALKEASKSETGASRDQLEDDLQKINSLLEDSWKADVTRRAADNIFTKRWNKVTAAPLASDLKLLWDYLNLSAKEIVTKLSSNERDVEAYNELLESVFCRCILFNRCHSTDILSKVLLSVYDKADNGDQSDTVLTITEQVLSKTCKSILSVRQKAVFRFLFHPDIQKDIDTLRSVRHIHFDGENEYLFGIAGEIDHLSGYKMLEKYAKLCGAKNPSIVSSTRLWKHVCTLTQIFSMSDADISDLVHRIGLVDPLRRVQDDVYQAAGLTKLLLLIESGQIEEYKGKTLDEIFMDLQEEVVEDATELVGHNTQPDGAPEEGEVLPKETHQTPKNRQKPEIIRAVSEIKRRRIVPWTSRQKSVVLKHFKKHIKMKKPPKRHECDELKEEYPELLQNKDWLKIKVFVQNVYTKKYYKYTVNEFED